MMYARPDLLAVHGALSALLHAVQLEISDISVPIRISYHPDTYLCVELETRWNRTQDKIVTRLLRGAIQGEYDYRFSLSHPTDVPDGTWRTIQAYPDMMFDHKKRLKQEAS
jgi:hypothetical protein